MKLRAPSKRPVLVRPVRANEGVRLAYQRQLEKLIDAMATAVEYHVKSAWRRVGLAMDADPRQQLDQAMRLLAARWEKTFQQAARTIAQHFAQQAASHQDNAFQAALRQAGFSVRMGELPITKRELNQAVKDNVDLISSIPTEHIDSVRQLVRESVEKGRSMKELTEHLRDRLGITRRRAALIARDQNNKLTAALHRARQAQVGITKARWVHTSASVHPRPEHESWDGELYDIDTGMYSDEDGEFVWPGTPIDCGCICMSVVPGLEDEEEPAPTEPTPEPPAPEPTEPEPAAAA